MPTPKINKNPKVDVFLHKADVWQKEMTALRNIVIQSGLTEELKWGHPCYTLDGKNILLIHQFKEYCALLFMKGALMKDPENILIQQTENVQAGRQIRFTSLVEIKKSERVIKSYIKDAIEVEKSGAKIKKKETTDYEFVKEFQDKLDAMPTLAEAFEALTPGRQRAYLLYFSAAKQSKTRTERIEKSIEKIMAGKGLNDE